MHMVKDVEMGTDLLSANREIADKNKRMLAARGVRAFDFLGAIGSGKTLLIERLVDTLKSRGIRCGVIAGDVAGEDDYQRFRNHDVAVRNVNTGKECHLDAHLVAHALDHLPLDDLDILFIENVGNLVCPADFPLGSEKTITVVSVTEGDDMIRKHPVLMGMTDVIVINKVELVEVMDVDIERLKGDAATINPNAPVVLTDARHGRGLGELLSALGLD